MALQKLARFEQDHLVIETVQPERGLILDEVKRRRDHKLGKDLSFGRCALTIPDIDYYKLIASNPDLNSQDGEIQTRAWMKFARSSISGPYRNFDRI